MNIPPYTRRQFFRTSIGSAAVLAYRRSSLERRQSTPARIRFAVIGVNHSHINGQVQTVIRGGGQLVSFFAKEPDLAAAFSKRYPDAKAGAQRTGNSGRYDYSAHRQCVDSQ